jgi:hypothetical protein
MDRYRILRRDRTLVVRLAGPYNGERVFSLLQDVERLRVEFALECLVWDTRRRTTEPRQADLLLKMKWWDNHWPRVAVLVGPKTDRAFVRMTTTLKSNRIIACRDTQEALGWIRGQIQGRELHA